MLNQEENGCAMTYMYEYPQYVPIKMEDKVTRASLTDPKSIDNYILGGSTISKVWVVCLWRRRGETLRKVALKT